MNRICPCCGNEIESDDVTLDDHGVCWGCHREILNGERCRYCYSPEHMSEDCEERDA